MSFHFGTSRGHQSKTRQPNTHREVPGRLQDTTRRPQDRLKDTRPAQRYREFVCGRSRARQGYSIWYVEKFWAWLENENLSPEELEPRHFGEYQRALESGAYCSRCEKYAKSTMTRLLSEALKMLRVYTDWGVLLRNPWAEFSPGRGPKRYKYGSLSQSRIREILSLPDLSCPRGLRDRAIFEIAYGSGLRLTEVAELSLGSVSLSERVVHLKNTKNGWDRTTPLTRAAVRFLIRYLEEARPLLTGPRSGNALWLSFRRTRLTSSGITTLVDGYRERLDFHFSFHRFRHSCATHLIEGGAGLMEVAALLGHEVVESSQYYTRVKLEKLREVHSRTHPRG